MTDWIWGDTDKPLVRVTPRIFFISLTRWSPDVSTGSGTFCYHFRSTMNDFLTFIELTCRLLSFALFSNMAYLGRSCKNWYWQQRHVSSSYCEWSFPSETACSRSEQFAKTPIRSLILELYSVLADIGLKATLHFLGLYCLVRKKLSRS